MRLILKNDIDSEKFYLQEIKDSQKLIQKYELKIKTLESNIRIYRKGIDSNSKIKNPLDMTRAKEQLTKMEQEVIELKSKINKEQQKIKIFKTKI